MRYYKISYTRKDTKDYCSIEIPENELGKSVRDLAKKNSEVIIDKIEFTEDR